MSVYAVIDNNLIINTVVGDDIKLVEFIVKQTNSNYEVIEIKESPIMPGIGWSYENGTFIAPPQPPITEPIVSDIVE
jgi:hypothetical protein